MPLPAQKFREMVFQMLYCADFSQGSEEDIVSMIMHELKVTKKYALEAKGRVKLILENINKIDDCIRSASMEYQFERISRVEKNVLRLGVFELLHDDRIPPKGAIAEAVRLCCKFGTPESAHFVNAILDVIFRAHTEIPTS
jgi:N utilization substance protein B